MTSNIKAEIVEDSVSPVGVRITTLKLEYPRFIHSEFMTHRAFSRNASSSRAIPAAKMIEQVRTRPATPIHWGKNQPGMQAEVELDEVEKLDAIALWYEAAEGCANIAERMNDMGIHKQIVNRILEPFQIMKTVVTATDWDNFFSLRCHKDAQPEIQALADKIRIARELADPIDLEYGEWHLPFVSRAEREEFHHSPNTLLEISTARCARVSYLTHEGKVPDVVKDVELYERLVGNDPRHASPCEHQATPLKDKDEYSRNFRGWLQHRELVEAFEK